MRIGIYSGTFDPIHEGHILFAQVASEQFGLDKVLLIPEAKPRFKQDVTSIGHRQRMSELAALDNTSEIQVVSIAGLPSHTINGVLREVYQLFPEDEYFIMLGSDVFKNVGAWGDRDDEDGSVKHIADNVGFIVGINNMAELPDLEKLAGEHSLNAQFVEPPLVAVSSRKIREAISKGREPYGLNDNVIKYIEFENLYGAKEI